MKQFLIIFFTFFISLPLAYAQTPPKPEKKVISSEDFEERLAQEKAKKEQIQKQIESLEKELDSTKSKLVDVGQSIQDTEQDLQQIDQKTTALEEEKETLEEKLKEDRLSISKLVMALERIRRVPPEALIARPDAPLETAQSAMLLRDIIPAIHQKAENLKKDLARQNEIANELATQKERAETQMASLQKEQDTLSDLMEKRETLFKKSQKDYQVREAEIQRISRASRNLKDLVQRLEKEQAEKEARELAARKRQQENAVRQAAVTAPSISMPPPGSARLPVSGIIRTRYNDLDKFGAKSEGLRIEGRPNGLVVAPMAGIVRFAGIFKNYDNMIIIEHDDGYHSLIGGLSDIDARVDQKISAGEPIGKLKSTTNGAKPALYYELRYKGRAIDPAKKFSDLG